MADTKISAMTAAAVVQDADLVPIVSAGANFAATRALMLTGGGGEDIVVQASTTQSSKLLSEDGTATVEVTQLNEVNIASAAKITLTADAGGGNLSIITMDPVTPSYRWDAAGPIFVQFQTATALLWNGAPPVDLATAIDRCALLLKTLNGGVGP